MPTFFGIFGAKYEWDNKFENDLKNTTKKIPKLTFGEVRDLIIHLSYMRPYKLKGEIGFRTFDSIKEEYNISNFNKRVRISLDIWGDGGFIELNDNDFIFCFEVRKKKLYYLTQCNNVDDW